MYHEMDFMVHNYTSRVELRKIVVSKFLEEEPGLGKGNDASHYRYNVETLSDGRRIYLTRPAYLKKGFDFRINVEGTIFQTGQEYPKHDDIFDDLREKRRGNPAMCGRLYQAIERVYNCEDPEDMLPECTDIKFNVGHPVDLILKVIKWFLIEQDIRDWNYSGRQMFKNGIDTILLE
ncbi:unnamed protein product [marine sediment metagenome]|uniref:DNA adenine methylase n=1 Tax=marine sediment metagenome TaxID=412755 RepID=X1PRJ0_9ZZZZ